MNFARLISNLSARFVNIAPERVDGEIEQSLRQVLEFFRVDRCALLKTLSDRGAWQVALVAYAEGIPPVPEKTDLPLSLFPWVASQILDRHKVVFFKTPEDLPPEADIDRQTYHAWGIKSSLTIPILLGGPVDYVLAINAVSHECVWSEDYVSRLRLLGEVFVNALERRRIYQELQESEARLSLAADSAGAMLWSLTIDSGHLWTTEKAKEFFGFEPGSQMDLESFLTIVHPEDREKLRRTVEETMRSTKD
ncbi:MAG TPA: GAF domain-containing protein, partial [Thermodesulfovibrionales bacterium]|nr:GAF domain-containing protein [Thermodesulfovibrionales bacterium]